MQRWPLCLENITHHAEKSQSTLLLAFVDLVKAYDTANHALLLDLLERYSAPPRFVAAIKRTYRDLLVVLKIEKEVVELPQMIEVHEGDNMAPVLFLFLMSAFAETLEAEWKRAGIGVCTVQSFVGQSLTSGKGKLRGHLPKEYLSRNLTAVKILQCLYVDDGAFIFKSREDMTNGLTLLYHHFGRLGLEMHIGHRATTSKTECTFFPLRASLILACLPSQPQVMQRKHTTRSITPTMHSPTTNNRQKRKTDCTENDRRTHTTH